VPPAVAIFIIICQLTDIVYWVPAAVATATFVRELADSRESPAFAASVNTDQLTDVVYRVPLAVSTVVEFGQLTDNFYRMPPVFATVISLVILLTLSTVCLLLLQLS
jgi:hypothetical protein